MFRYYVISLLRYIVLLLYATTLWRTTAVVWQWSYVNNLDNLDTSTVYGTDSTLTAITRTLDEGLDLAQTQAVGYLSAILGGHLSSVRSVLLGTTETHLAGGRPRDDLTLIVGKRYNDIVEAAVDMKLSCCLNTYISFLVRCCFLLFCHV